MRTPSYRVSILFFTLNRSPWVYSCSHLVALGAEPEGDESKVTETLEVTPQGPHKPEDKKPFSWELSAPLWPSCVALALLCFHA